MPRKALLFSIAVAAAIVLPDRLEADEVIFTNGDKLTGTITTLSEGKLTISGTVVGDVTTDLSNVRTFSTDKPVEIHTVDQRTMNEQISPGAEAGQVSAAGGAMALTQSYSINPRTDQKKDAWTGSLVVGGVLTRGNTHTQNINVSANATRERHEPLLHDRASVGGGYVFGRQRDQDSGENVTTTDNWFAQGKYDYFWTQKYYTYALMKIEHDRIANLDYRLSPGVGMGYEWSERWNLHFTTELGATDVYESYSNDGHQQHVALRAAYHVDKKFNDAVTLFHDLEYLPAFEDPGDYNLNIDGGFRTQLTKQLFAEFRIEWKRDSTPAPEALKNDLRYTLGIGWNF